jgi:hypothetical protein
LAGKLVPIQQLFLLFSVVIKMGHLSVKETQLSEMGETLKNIIEHNS